MAEKFEDLNLPNAVVTRIAKEALPDNVGVAKEARTALAKAASVFVLYITSASNGIAMKNNRRTINGQDVIQAMEEAEFNTFIEPLRECLANFKKFQREKKDASAKRKQEKKADNDVNEEDEEEDDNTEYVNEYLNEDPGDEPANDQGDDPSDDADEAQKDDPGDTVIEEEEEEQEEDEEEESDQDDDSEDKHISEMENE